VSIPYSQALAAFNKERKPGMMSFDEVMAWHFNHGFVFSTPIYFIMGRPVNSKAPVQSVLDPSVQFEADDCDAWHVCLAAGNLEQAWTILPWPLGLIGFDRKGELRFYDIDRVRRLTK
jgi:hypothetical protein